MHTHYNPQNTNHGNYTPTVHSVSSLLFPADKRNAALRTVIVSCFERVHNARQGMMRPSDTNVNRTRCFRGIYCLVKTKDKEAEIDKVKFTLE